MAARLAWPLEWRGSPDPASVFGVRAALMILTIARTVVIINLGKTNERSFFIMPTFVREVLMLAVSRGPLSSESSAVSPDLAAVKKRQQATWASGDFAVVASRIVLQ